MSDTGPKHPTWDGASTLEPTDLNRRAQAAMVAFYLGQGFMEAPTWEEIGDDFRFGFRSIVQAFDRDEIPPRAMTEQELVTGLENMGLLPSEDPS